MDLETQNTVSTAPPTHTTISASIEPEMSNTDKRAHPALGSSKDNVRRFLKDPRTFSEYTRTSSRWQENS